MPLQQRILALTLSLALLLATIYLVRRRKLHEEYALLWLLASSTNFLLAIFASSIRSIGEVFGVIYAPTLILVLGLVFTMLIVLSQSVVITRLADQTRDLAQTISILEWSARQMEAKMTNGDNGASSDGADVSLAALVERQPGTLSEATPAAPHHKVLVIGLDGATFDLIEPWAAAGHLPALSRILREGARGRLLSTTPPITAAAWTAFATGTNPGKHGLYDWIARKPGTYQFMPVTALDCATPTLYDLLSAAGRRVCALNIPMTFPPTPVNGYMVSGLPAPSTNGITYPPELYDQLIKEIGDYVLYPDPGQAYSDAGVDAFLKRLYRTTDLRIRAFDYLRNSEPWDFAMVVFNGTDTASHALWKYMDRSHPLHDPSKDAKYGHAIRDFYQTLDSYLMKVIETLDDNTTLVVMSDHGFGPFHKFIHVNNWLIQTGFMRLKRDPKARLKASLFKLGFSPMNAYDWMMRLGLGALKREVVRGQGQGLLKSLFLSFDDVDWSQTRAYSLGNVGQINLNVVGREPHGCVHPGAEYEQVRTEIMDQIARLRDPQTGELAVESVQRREEIYAGDQFDKAPDIVFMPRRLEYFGFGEYEFGSHKIIEAMRRGISGTHRMHGIFMAYGKAIRAGVEVNGASLVDLAPTILHLLGEPIPQHMDGRALTEVVAETFQPQQVSQQERTWSVNRRESGDVMSAEEEQLLSERLRSLGYVG